MSRFHNCQANLERAVSAAGSHYFDRDTMRFFRSKVYDICESTDDGTAYVVMSNRATGAFASVNDGRRYYYVIGVDPRDRIVKLDGIMPETPGGVSGWLTLESARRFARKMASRRAFQGPTE